ncbi:retrovirus-related pol polyprotein from transposon TNT 1-94 [Tanacetum coccineum]|uniref:Retrovirus-related pol polyprotein from transposon TNT 1-94 n=1 Tax=Tanacetum coccineum TaxID=301880 RepID=A0ABQ5GL79_9ASTR
MAIFMDWFCKKQGITELTQKDMEGPAFEIVKVFHPNVIHLQYQMEECHKLLTDQVDDAIIRHNVSKPLPLGGQPGQVTIQSDFFFNKDLEYLRYGSKGGRPTLSISKMKAAYYPDVGLEQMVPDQMWIEEECKYDIAAMYGISHWWFQRQQFYIDRHTSEGDRRAVRTHMRILSVVRIEVFSLYGYDYMKTIILRRADLNEYITAGKGLQISVPDQLMDQKLGDQTTAVTFKDKYGVQMIMRFNEIHKFSDGTLQQIDEAMDYRVKEFKVNRINPGLDTRFWTRKDVKRSKEFMFANEKELLQVKFIRYGFLLSFALRKEGQMGLKWVYRTRSDDRGVVVRNKQIQCFPKKVYKVVKALYGLHQAPRAWYATLSTFLLKSRYRRGTIDKALFIKKDKNDIMLVQVYVDDIIFGSIKRSWCDEFEALMKSRFQMRSMGELTFFLGLQVKQKEDGIFISREKYVVEILKKFDFTCVKTASTPIETQKPLTKDEEAGDVDIYLYRS